MFLKQILICQPYFWFYKTARSVSCDDVYAGTFTDSCLVKLHRSLCCWMNDIFSLVKSNRSHFWLVNWNSELLFSSTLPWVNFSSMKITLIDRHSLTQSFVQLICWGASRNVLAQSTCFVIGVHNLEFLYLVLKSVHRTCQVVWDSMQKSPAKLVNCYLFLCFSYHLIVM